MRVCLRKLLRSGRVSPGSVLYVLRSNNYPVPHPRSSAPLGLPSPANPPSCRPGRRPRGWGSRPPGRGRGAAPAPGGRPRGPPRGGLDGGAAAPARLGGPYASRPEAASIMFRWAPWRRRPGRIGFSFLPAASAAGSMFKPGPISPRRSLVHGPATCGKPARNQQVCKRRVFHRRPAGPGRWARR